MIIRFYDQAYTTERLTVLMNPYHEFLQCLISANQEEKTQIMKNLLVNESVKETYNWLKRSGKLERRLNMFEYLHANQLI
jgi:TnpA family transposase